MQLKREITDILRSQLEEFPAVLLTGARQVGKTTLLRGLLPNHSYVSLDTPSIAEMAAKNPDLFLRQYPPPLIIDEVQYAPEVFRHLKVWIDNHRESKGQIVLTGSQKFVLMKEVAESLAGRIGILELEPLSVQEIGESVSLTNADLPELLTRGFFPELWKERQRSSNSFHSSYLTTYLERDLRQLINVASLLDFERFLRLLATRVGQTIEKSSLAKDLGVRANTINSWLSVLEASNQIVFLQPFHENMGSRLIKSPKLYFSDVGLCSHLLGLDSDGLLSSAILGSMWENLVFCELRKRNLASAKPGQFWFYRDSLAREVDILFVRNGKIHFIETKWTMQPETKTADLLVAISSRLKSRVVTAGSLAIVSRTSNSYSVTDRVMTHSILDFELPQ